MIIICPNCGEELEFYESMGDYDATCDCGFHGCIEVRSVLEPERWEETE